MQVLREQEIKAVEAKQKALTAQRLLAENEKNAEELADGLFETENEREKILASVQELEKDAKQAQADFDRLKKRQEAAEAHAAGVAAQAAEIKAVSYTHLHA